MGVSAPQPSGICIVDKQAGLTSHDVVARARRQLGTSKVGHSGTLDPDATGVLVLGVGRATRLLRFLAPLAKVYTGEVVLGIETTSLDSSGEVTATHDMEQVTLDQARAAADAMVGPQQQTPPMVSAVKVGGRRLHQLAREGVEVDRQARPVTVHHFDISEVKTGPAPGPSGPVLAVEVACSSGTYVRVLAADLGRALGGGAHLRHLRRRAIGPYTEERARAVEDLELLAPIEAVRHLDVVAVDDEVAALVRRGIRLRRSGESVVFEGPGPWALTSPEGDLLAVYEAKEIQAYPAVVLSGS